jgi:ketosteroid isomerase-like protein
MPGAAMSRENVHLVQQAFEAFLRGDLDAVAAVLDPDATWTWIEPGPWDCHDAGDVLRVLRRRRTEDMVGDLREIVDAGDHVVLRLEHGDPETYGADPGETAVTLVATVRDGRIVHLQDYRSRAQALHAVGLD